MNVGQAFTLVGVAAGGIWIGMKAKTYLDEREVYQHYEDALSEVVERALRPFDEAGTRFAIEGPSVRLQPGGALTMALILHELATNALKYGALSNADGRVTLAWTYDPDSRMLEGVWVESGGPTVVEPTRKGFGSRLIERSLRGELRGGGLVAPAIRDVDGMDLAGLMAALRDLVGRARSGGLRSSELTDATITVTSLGERGAYTVMGVIYPPQVAIVGFGRIVERPFIAGGRVKKRPVISVSLAADHRASDGHIGGLFLSDIDRLLQEPGKL